MKKYILSLTVLFLIGAYTLFFKDNKKSNFAPLEFQSYQSIYSKRAIGNFNEKTPKIFTKADLKKTEFQPKSRKKLNTRTIAEKSSRENKIGKYLTSSLEDYGFNESIFAIRKRDFKGNRQEILGEIMGMIVFKNSNPPPGALSLIKKNSEDRVGIYTGKIILIHKQDNKLENEISAILGDQEKISHVSEVYIIESPNVADSIQLLTNLKEKLKKIQIDLDINYSRNEAK